MASRRNNPNQVVSSAAYLLFYRRRSSTPLGGKFFEDIMHKVHNPQAEVPSGTQSRTESPSTLAGEGRRLDDSSRNGLSSAFLGAAAGHQAGGGEPATVRAMGPRTRNDEKLPDYSENDPGELPFESMETDEPLQASGFNIQRVREPTWEGFADDTFDCFQDETLGDTRRGSLSSTANASFGDDEDRDSMMGGHGYASGTPNGSSTDLYSSAPMLLDEESMPQIKIDQTARGDEVDDGNVAEIKLSEGEESVDLKMD